MNVIFKIIGTIVLIAVTLLLQKLLQRAVDRYVTKNKIHHRRTLAIHKVKTVLLYIFAVFIGLYIWGLNLENVWISITGILGLVAIGFFAVWSILSNIFAGLMLFFNQSFGISDKIEIMPEGITGTIKDINLFFVILVDDEGNTISMPNNLMFQKMVKKIKAG